MTEYQRGVLIVAFGAILFAPDSLMLRLMAMEQWPTVLWRSGLGGILVTAVFLAWLRGGYFRAVRALGWRGMAFMLCYSATTMCFVYAVRETTVANTLFIVSTSPVFSAALSWAFLNEAPDRPMLRTIGLALVGVGLIAFGGEEGGAGRRMGDLAALGAALFLALSFVLARQVRPLTMAPLTGPASLVTAAIALFFVADFSIPEHALWPLLAMALFIMPIGALCLTIGPRYIPAAEVSLLMLIEAALAPLIVWWALSESPALETLIGGAIILCAIAWNSLERMGRA